MILLTDEEIDKAKDNGWNYYISCANVLIDSQGDCEDRAIAKAQLKNVWNEWNNSLKPLITHSSGSMGYEREWVDKFWEALLKEI